MLLDSSYSWLFSRYTGNRTASRCCNAPQQTSQPAHHASCTWQTGLSSNTPISARPQYLQFGRIANPLHPAPRTLASKMMQIQLIREPRSAASFAAERLVATLSAQKKAPVPAGSAPLSCNRCNATNIGRSRYCRRRQWHFGLML